MLSYDTLSALLPVLAGGPLLMAGVMILLGRTYVLQTALMFVSLLAMLGFSIGLIFRVDDGEVIAHGTANWPMGIAIPFVLDMFSALMLLTTTILALTCAWFAVASGLHRERFFAPLVMILMTGVYGAILTADIFNFFVFIEVMLLPSYGLYALTMARRAPDKRVDGLRLYISANLLASTVLLIGVGFVYGTAGTVNLAELAGVAAEDDTVAIAMAVVMLAMLTKASVVPIHTWLTRTYNYTSPAITALFSGLHTKVGVYITYRLYAVVFGGDDRFLWVFVALFTATMFFGVMGAVGEFHSRSILVFHMVSQLGYILMGVALFTQVGLTAGIFYLVHHMLVKASLFMSTGAVEVRYGSGQIGRVTGIAKREPIIAIAFFIAALSLAGIPPFSGFVAKASLMIATWEASEVLALITMVVVSIITLLSMLKIWGGMFWGDEKDEEKRAQARARREARERRARKAAEAETGAAATAASVAIAEKTDDVEKEAPHERRIGFFLAAPSVILAGMTIAIGLGAEVLLGWSETAAEGLMDTSTYVEAVQNS